VFGNMCVLCDVLCESEPGVGSWFVSMQIFQVGGDVRGGHPQLAMGPVGDGLPYQWLFCYPLSCFP